MKSAEQFPSREKAISNQGLIAQAYYLVDDLSAARAPQRGLPC